VRTCKESLASFRVHPDAQSPVSPPLQSRIQGFGSAVSSAEGAAAASALGGAAAGGARMMGFGNPRYEGGAGRPGRVTSPKGFMDAAAAALGAGPPARRAPFMREEVRAPAEGQQPCVFWAQSPGSACTFLRGEAQTQQTGSL